MKSPCLREDEARDAGGVFPGSADVQSRSLGTTAPFA